MSSGKGTPRRSPTVSTRLARVIQISQSSFGSGFDVLYRTVRHKEDYTGGHNCWLTRHDLARMSYRQFLDTLLMLRKEDTSYERAA